MIGIHQGVLVLTVCSAVYAGSSLFIGHTPDRRPRRRVAAAAVALAVRQPVSPPAAEPARDRGPVHHA